MLKNSLSDIKKEIKNTVATNNNAIYKSHLYWSQKPFNITDILIDNFSNENEVILDPFMGSGVTLIESLNKKYNRCAIGVEINDVPIFIVNTLLNKYDISDLKKQINHFINKVKLLNSYYDVTCDVCKEIGTIQKVLFHRNDWKSEPQIQTIYYKCKCNKKILEKEATLFDYFNLNIEHICTNIEDIELIKNSRLAVYEGEKISNIFTKRNFALLDIMISYSNEYDSEISNCIKYIILSTIHLAKITDTHSNSQWPLWTPKNGCIEKNIVQVIEKRANLLIKSLEMVNEQLVDKRQECKSFKDIKDGRYMILKKGIQLVTNDDIPEGSVDLIITDPPYLGQVLYSEYMQLYKPFLKFKINLQDEIVISSAPDRNKKEDEYYRLLEKAFKVACSKLKYGKYMCMYFHDSNLEVWDKLIKIMENVEMKYLSQVHIKKKNTLKNIISPKKSLNGDAVLFFVKQHTITNINYDDNIESIEEIEQNIVKHAKYAINKYGPLTTPELYDDGIMEFIIHNGWLSKLSTHYKSLVDIFEKSLKWDSSISKWTIKQ